MKKMTCLLMSLLLMLLCGGALAEGVSDADVTGIWYCDLFGITVTLTVNEGGTYQIENDDIAPYFGTWKLSSEELILDEGTENEIALEVEKDSLSVSFIGLTMLFRREMPQQYVPAAVRTDAAIEEFAGEWSMTHMNIGELCFYSHTVNVHVGLNISGTDALVFLQVEGNENYVLSAEAFSCALLTGSDPGSYTAEMKGSFEDGVLTLTEVLPDAAPADKAAAEGDSEESEEVSVPVVWEVRLLEDGTLCVIENTDPLLPLTYYMTPIMPLTMAE